MTFTDSGVVTAAYVAHALGLPAVGPLESVEILQNKGKFRKFLTDNGFNVPTARSYHNATDALKDEKIFRLPVIVKPVDSAGSKGVTKVDSWNNISTAIDWALKFSLSKEFIIEEFIEKRGNSSDCDCFSCNGKIVVTTFNSQWFDVDSIGLYTPAAYCWPSTFTKEEETYLASEIQRAITLLGMRSTIYNVETRVGIDGKPYIMEISPRGGGNRLAEIIRMGTGVDLISNYVRVTLGEPCVDIEQKPFDGSWAEIILHSDNDGKFDHLDIADTIRPFVVEEDLWKQPGDEVSKFISARDAIGTLVLRFPDEKSMREALMTQRQWLRVVTK